MAYPAPIRPAVDELETSGIQQVFDRGIGRPDVIGLWVGEGDLPTPGFICEATEKALRDGQTFYTYKRGLPELRQAIADYTAGLYGIAADPERVTVTSSGMTGIVHVLQAILTPGEKVAVVSPVWPNIMAAVEMAGATVVQVPLDARPDGGFRLDLERLAAALDPSTRAVFVASPSNPTGWMMEAEEQAALLELCRGRGIWVIADEVYHRFTYDRPHAPSFAQHAGPEDALICVHSFSKAWAMTGWRMGWLLHPPSLGETFGKLIEYTTSGAPAFLQAGCLAAITQGEDFVAGLVERCRTGGEIVFQGLSALPGVTLARPQAAFYSFFRLEGLDDSLDFCFRLLDEAKVGLAPGSAFGRGGEGYLRLCFASSPERLSTAMDRLRRFLVESRQVVDSKA
ncbi:Aspartate/methionine/tyrosine aminotransferase [Tistlia consotensis]|uniref:Aminotransferase n=1 Tax=Tistlia consotensis USBA 355 TaxID=560819 RepID=A0A1Y6CKE5_9PROT|nr:pyridoxal phosphate-dependent aminotransferase [Tistlia consotensis]SMF72657.1 Aspartate/methionine/tyrosine aminotransferase [Tistlia consotensis USBA 355]SNS09633.1 Aspartate/methionine/tyrosine aminotransferase [Tistlia consotensis]